jgi:DRTGG domain
MNKERPVQTFMIRVNTVIEKLNLETVSSVKDANRPVMGGYATDLLSCAMRGAKKDFLWVTLQSHVNVVAVASLLNLAGVIITEGNRPAPETIAQAEKEKVNLLLTPQNTFSVVGQLTILGISGD